ncbi:FG-GAP repeat domain-containing protein [Streptomyces sp. NPDC056543]|uniref:FG-GAP repeat domain-containing protein n=1 Tax=unclassified Streptomyces TaxID=2593676 RepID=UPI00369CDA39
MRHAHRSRRRLAAAVTAVLAVTAGALVSTPAVATPIAVRADATVVGTEAGRQDVIAYPRGAETYAAGSTGFLSSERNPEGSPTTYTYRWTRLADGVTTVLPGSYYLGSASDVIVMVRGRGAYTVYDMATGADPVEIDTSGLGTTQSLKRVSGSTLAMTVANTNGGTDLRLVSKPNGTLLDLKVAGLPGNARITRVDSSMPGTLVVLYSGTVDGVYKNRIALVDLATHKVVEDRETLRVEELSDAFVSSTHTAWIEKPTDGTATLAVAPRGTGETERFPLGVARYPSVGLVGDWVTYAVQHGDVATTPDPLHPLTARSLKTGATVRLLEHMSSAALTPDGSMLVRGGTLEHGEGLYRISVGADGNPVTTLVATTGEPTLTTLLGQDMPSVVDFDRNGGTEPLTFSFSKGNVRVSVELTHTASGKKSSAGGLTPPGDGGPATFQWDGRFTDSPAYNGDYSWTMKATPANGIGPAMESSGTLTVVRKAVARDFSNNGNSDLLVRDGAGKLVRYDSGQVVLGSMLGPLEVSPIGGGWNIYDQIIPTGNLSGAPHADLVARDRSGGLWLYEGTGATPGAPLSPRKFVGGGWQIYDKVVSGSELTGDGKADLLATDRAGVLWLYAGTGNTSAPFSPRKKIGAGWGVYNHLIAAGNLGGASGGDLLARDREGVLWLYLGKGDGSFASRTKVGGGWNAYSQLVGIGDVDRDGRADLLTHTPSKDYWKSLRFYAGTGDWRAPFTSRTSVYDPGLGQAPLSLY